MAVDIYRGTRLGTTSTRLEVAAKSPYLHQLLTSIKMCDGCKEPTTLIFPAEDETKPAEGEAKPAEGTTKTDGSD